MDDGKGGTDTANVTINFIGAANIVTMTRSTDVLISSSPEDILDIDQAAILGGLNIDLGNASDQIISYNGSNNSGSITGFESVLADGYTGSFGAQITGSSNTNTITSTSNADVVMVWVV